MSSINTTTIILQFVVFSCKLGRSTSLGFLNLNMKRNEGDSGNCSKERHWKVTFTTGRLVQSSMRKFIDHVSYTTTYHELTKYSRLKADKERRGHVQFADTFFLVYLAKRRAKLQDRPRYPAVLAIE